VVLGAAPTDDAGLDHPSPGLASRHRSCVASQLGARWFQRPQSHLASMSSPALHGRTSRRLQAVPRSGALPDRQTRDVLAPSATGSLMRRNANGAKRALSVGDAQRSKPLAFRCESSVLTDTSLSRGDLSTRSSNLRPTFRSCATDAIALRGRYISDNTR
jgi:hypothetical protein